MKLSVVIPTCNRPVELAACLERLAPGAQTLDAGHYEVIVTDDWGPETRVEVMITKRFPWARWVAGPRRGPAANRNHGASRAEGDVLVFFDDDCLPDAGVLAAYAAHFAATEAADAVEGRITADRVPARLDEEAPVNETGGLFWSCNIAVRTAVFRRLGGFDERFRHAAMEDVELRRRLKLAGCTIMFLPGAMVVHPLRRMGGWETMRRRAEAHGLYVRMAHTDMRPFAGGYVMLRIARSWWRGILPQLVSTRGRGLWRRALYSLLPVLCAVEMRRASRLPSLAVWTANTNTGGGGERGRAMSIAAQRTARPGWLKWCLGWIDSNEWPFMPPRCWRAEPAERELWELRRLARCWMRARLVERQGWGRTITQAVVWPFWSLVKTTRFIRAMRHTVYAGLSPARAWGHAYRLLMLHNLRLEDQSDITLDVSQLVNKARSLMVCRELQAVLGAMHATVSGYPEIDRKQAFARFCAANGLPAPAVLSEGRGGRGTKLRPWPAADVFFKPAEQGKGKNIEWFRHDPVARGWRDEGGATVTPASVPTWAENKIGDETWLVQERLENAPSWRHLTTGSLATCRVITARDQAGGEPRVLAIFVRFPVASASVDNLSAGGLGAGVDPQTGEMTSGKIWGGVTMLHTKHPVTGAQIAGAVLPGFDVLRDLALRAHRAAGDWTSVGWDVAMTTRGPVLIEANLQWAVCFHQTMIEVGLLELLRKRFGANYPEVLRPRLSPC